MINDFRFNLYNANGNLNKTTYFSPSPNFRNYVSYDLFNRIKNINNFSRSKILGYTQDYIYSVYRGGGYYSIYELDLKNQQLNVYSNATSKASDSLCFSNGYNLICGDYVNIISSGTNYNNLYDLFENGSFSYIASTYGNITLGSSYIDDLMYSNKSTDILVYSFYLLIPLILFILAIKVFRKGLFR